MIFSKKTRVIFYMIIILLAINYMVVTIIFHDNIALKYLRDILLIVLFVKMIRNNRLYLNNTVLIFSLFFICLIIGAIKTDSISIAFSVIRRYVFPLFFLYILSNINIKNNYTIQFKFILKFIFILSVFGIIQAIILGDNFLRYLGYPLEYSYSYGRMMLYNSFYFGGLGLQRVVATFSSSNICGLVLGSTLLYFLVCKKFTCKTQKEKIFLIVIFAAYVLTFSRSNFLSFIICGLFLAWPYIPYKKNIIVGICAIGVVAVIIGILQGSSGFLYKLWGWVQTSLNFTESSVAGRSSIWRAAFDAAIRNPLGIGLGHVGALGTANDLVYSAENSYLTIALDTGWFGLIFYLFGLLRMVVICKKSANKFRSLNDENGFRLCKGAEIVTIYMMIVMFFSNHIQDMEAVVFVYLYLGTAISYIRHNIKCCEVSYEK